MARPAAPIPALFAGLRQHPRRRPLLARLFALAGLHRQRRQLGALPPHLLADIGVTPEAASAESARPLWDAPEHWRG